MAERAWRRDGGGIRAKPAPVTGGTLYARVSLAKRRHRVDELPRLQVEALGGHGSLLDQGRILLRDLVHLRDRLSDVRDARRSTR